MKNSLFEKITRAIDKHAVLKVTDDAGARFIEPYLIFESTDGDMLLHGWQRGGAYRRTPPPRWCNLHLDDIAAVELLADRFSQPHGDYNPRSPNFHRVVFEINGRGPRRAATVEDAGASSRVVPPRRSPPRRKGTGRTGRSSGRH
jgi:hypothetical protein